MIEIITAIARMDLFAEQAHQQVEKYIAERFDEILFLMEEMGYPGDQVLEIATRHILLKQHGDNGKNQALIEINRIVTDLQSDDDFMN